MTPLLTLEITDERKGREYDAGILEGAPDWLTWLIWSVLFPN